MADDFSRIATPVKQENAEWKRVWLIVRIARIIPVKNLMETSNIIGTTFREIIEENGRDTELHGIITDYIQNEVISFQLLGKYNSVDVKYSLEKSGETTRLTQIANIHFKSTLTLQKKNT